MSSRSGFALVLIIGLATVVRAAPPQERRPIRESEIAAVIQAIEDEIYDLNLEHAFFDLGTGGDKVVLNVYFQPEVLDNSRSWIIYKLMPGGEVYRMYQIGRSGRIYLFLKPGEFRITQPSYPTVYMDDDELCKLKHEWIKRQFVVDTNPNPALVAAARARQRDRERHSYGPAGEPPASKQ
jgi:hypothetical protein